MSLNSALMVRVFFERGSGIMTYSRQGYEMIMTIATAQLHFSNFQDIGADH